MWKEALPEMEEGEYGPSCQVSLPVWEDFYWTDGPAGPVTLNLGGDEEPPLFPGEGQERAWAWVTGRQEEVCRNILQAVFDYLGEQRRALEEEDMDDDEPWEPELNLPDAEYPGGLRDWMRLRRVHILNVEKDGTAYTGYEFACSWDREQGVGVLAHKSRVVEVGGADTSLLSWLARDDAKRNGLRP